MTVIFTHSLMYDHTIGSEQGLLAGIWALSSRDFVYDTAVR